MANTFGWPPATTRPSLPASHELANDVGSVARRWVATAYDNLRRAGPERADQVRHILDGYIAPWFGPQTTTVADVSYVMTHGWLLALAGREPVGPDDRQPGPTMAPGASRTDDELSLRQAAATGQVSLTTARRRWRDGELPGAYRDSHGHVRVPEPGAVALREARPAGPLGLGLSQSVIGDALWVLRQVLAFSGSCDAVVGHLAPAAHGSGGASPARSSMIMVMKRSGSWNPRALARMRPMAAFVLSAKPFVNFHSSVASREAR